MNFVLWLRLLERYSATTMTGWLFLIPVFGVLVGGLLVVAGVLLSQRQPSHKTVVLTA